METGFYIRYYNKIKASVKERIRCNCERQTLGALNIVTIRNTKYVLTRLQFLCLENRS